MGRGRIAALAGLLIACGDDGGGGSDTQADETSMTSPTGSPTSAPATTMSGSSGDATSAGPSTTDSASSSTTGDETTTSGGGAMTIVDVTFDTSTLLNATPIGGKECRGCDNWPITETASGIQFTSWGDGDGFDGGTRASMGVARIEGSKDNYSADDLWKSGADSGGFNGKSYGLIAIGDDLYMWRSGNGSDAAGYALEELYKSTDSGVNFELTSATWYPEDFSDNKGFSNLTFCQFGPGYDGGGDTLYVYGFEEEAGDWNVQYPGRVSLMRVPVTGIEDTANYEYFAGLDGGAATWTGDIEAREPVFEDTDNGMMRLSVAYRAPIQTYVLMAQQVDRNFPDARLGIYQAAEPWGPFTDAMPTNPADPKTLGAPIPIIADGQGDEADAEKTVFFGISNKWSDEMPSPGGFVMVYTGDWQDEWGSVEGEFVLQPD